jgi:hypothetical protein
MNPGRGSKVVNLFYVTMDTPLRGYDDCHVPNLELSHLTSTRDPIYGLLAFLVYKPSAPMGPVCQWFLHISLP